MSILRFIIDVEADGDVTSADGEAMREKLEKYADSVVGVQQLGNKQGDDGQATWHVHRSNESYSCDDCIRAARDERN